MLWIALHLPLLSLETFAARLPPSEATAPPQASAPWPRSSPSPPPPPPPPAPPLALIDGHQIVSVNEPARALGVRSGMKRATALALAPHLKLGQADPAGDAEALTAVAHAALAFTPNVSIQPASGALGVAHPDTVLLEVRPSLRYFGGLTELLRRLHADLAPLGHCLHTVSAPTALGAALLARIHLELHCAEIESARAALGAAPVWLLGPGRLHWDALQGMGLRSLSDLRRLPRTGLARRFGEAVLDEFDRAFGHRPDLRKPLTLAPTFESRLELFARADSTEQVVHGASLLLPRLAAWLSAQHSQARRFTLVMAHEPRWRASQTPAATPLEIALAEPSRDVSHLMALLRERLARTLLPAPTLELRLQCTDIAHGAPPNYELFSTPRNEQEGLTRLIERLQARLGPEQIQRLAAIQDYRPEHATQVLMADASRLPRSRPGSSGKPANSNGKPANNGGSNNNNNEKPLSSSSIRPVWLFTRAEPLAGQGATPMLGNMPLQLLSGPERIESGWWDGELAERDYYIAQQPDGALLWIYRSRLLLSAPSQGWFWQGGFG